MGAKLYSIKDHGTGEESPSERTQRCLHPYLNGATRSRLMEFKSESKASKNTVSNNSHVCVDSPNVAPIEEPIVRSKGSGDRGYRVKLSEFMALYKGTIVSKYTALSILTPESSHMLKKPNITWLANTTESSKIFIIKTIQLNISYAIKTDNYLANLKLLRNLDSPFLPKIYEFFIENDLLHICMERYDCQNLKDYIARKGPLKPELISVIMFQLASLLRSLHKDELLIQALNPNDILLIKKKNQILIKVTNIESLIKLKKNPKPRRATDFKPFRTAQLGSFSQNIRKASTMHAVRVKKCYKNKGDIWCLGKILYYMLSNVYHSWLY
jgi:hypothetical protein